MIRIFTLAIFCMALMQLQAQTLVKGNVSDDVSDEILIGCTILLEGTSQGTTTDLNGDYTISVPGFPATLLFSYVGYEDQSIILESQPEGSLNVLMSLSSILIDEEVIISASRITETLREAPRSVQKITAKQVLMATSGDFYKDIGSLKEIDVTSSSLGFQIINSRGFNSTAATRMMQFVDGVDQQSPGLNFPFGNLMGIPDVDLQSVEVISGASSTLYGANAFQGVITMVSKNPFDYPGLQIKVKGGSNELFDGQIRWAQTFGKKKNFGIKFTGGYFRARDWEATDTAANLYGDIEADVNVSNIIRELQFDEDPELAADFRALNAYLDFYPVALPGDVNVQAPGYQEVAMADPYAKSIKAGMQMGYKFGDEGKLSYQYKFGQATGVYQGSNRYSVNNIIFHQNNLQLDYKGFKFKYYSTIENAGDSYDLVFTAINLSKFGVGEYVGEWIGAYFDTLSYYTNEFSDEPREWQVEIARAVADSIADQLAWLEPGTALYDSVYNATVTNPDLNTGSKFQDKSSLHHFEAQYGYDYKSLNLLVGAAYRLSAPKSYGTIFRDTLVNYADTLLNGEVDQSKDFVNLNIYDVSAYAQGVLSFLDDDRLKLTASIRMDKSKNYDVQFSPGVSTVFSWKKNTIRWSGQTAFRSPTLQNQYILLDLGVIKLKGNLDGITNAYTHESVEEFNELYEEEIIIDPSLLVPYFSDPIKPEQVYSTEVGYRGAFGGRFYVDMNAYVSWYKDFIGNIRVDEPGGEAHVTEETGVDAILTDNYDLIQYPTNASEGVLTYGTSIGLNYYLWKNLAISANYTFSDLNTKNLTDPIIPGFNTPKHKVNVGVGGDNLWKGLGFSVRFKWLDDFLWESTFGDGEVPSYYTLDAQLNYTFKKYFTLQVGGSNITNNEHIEAYGSPTIGWLAYGSILFDLERN